MRGQISKFVGIYPSSVTEIGSEVPISVTASPQGEAFGRSRASAANYNFSFQIHTALANRKSGVL